ncbi:MAG TPA: zf-HC2 domain-containing protein [Phycisphaerae bacterium]|nr:zf-HC2 domain-containing protein [Phycisphaerae bacterium]
MADERTCNEIRSLMADWLDGELSAALRVRVDEHLAACDSCRAAFDQMQAMGGDLALLGRAGDRMAVGATQRVQVTPTWSRAWVRAAAVTLLVAGGVYFAVARRGNVEPVAIVERTPIQGESLQPDRPAIVSPGECSAPGRAAVALATSNPRVRIVWLFEDSDISEGSTESSGGARPRPQG